MKDNSRKYAIQSRAVSGPDRTSLMLNRMAENKAYQAACDSPGCDEKAVLKEFENQFSQYRKNWRELPRTAITKKLTGDVFRASGATPLCIDLEVAAVCDLACPFCYRQRIATPDKIMNPDLAFRLIDEASALGVPSIKFNWRGEPLLNPHLPEFIAYAKNRGVIDTLINTNATELNDDMSRQLIDAGLDLMIYSFDGGTQESYERMRPGRFKKNTFEKVYGNIRRFREIRDELGATFPFTKIQMILTEQTFQEQDAFYDLFENYVDEISVKQYTERGAGLSDLDKTTRDVLSKKLSTAGLPENTPYLRDMDGTLHLATGRLPCEQPYQRLLITYDGKVGMCCYDWGARHLVGYVDDASFSNPDHEYEIVFEKAARGEKGFEVMQDLSKPEHFNRIEMKIKPLADIWYGAEIDRVRKAHVNGNGGDIPICQQCPFKETFKWEKIDHVSG